MRKIIISAFLLALMPAVVLAQSFPLTLPSQSVYGRLGIPGTNGPGQAIPFANLLANLTGVAFGGKARMIPHVGQTTSASDCYTLTDPYGNAIACTTSTTTQGLQEFLNAAAANGWPAEVDCQGTQFPGGAEPIFIQATTSVTVPVAQDWSFHSYGCNLNSSVTTVPALIVDSEGASVFDWDGKIVYNVTAPNGNVTINPSCVVYINPTTNTADGFAGLYAGYFRVKSPVANPVSGTTTGVVCINASTGSTTQTRLDFTEVNANNVAYHGVFVFGASGTTGLLQTEINVNQIHGAVTDGVNEGNSSSHQANYNGNQWKINNIENNGASSRGVDTWGSNDNWQLGVINNVQGGLQYGIAIESAAASNHFDYGNIVGASSAAILDSGTCTFYSGPQGSQIQFWGSTSGCTAVKASAAAGGTQTWPVATGNVGAMGFAELKPFPSQGAGAWHATDPFGNDISTSGTTCQGLDSLLTAASSNGWSWRVVGNGTISCTAPLQFPTCFVKSEYIDVGVTIAFTAQTSNPLIKVDSHENCYSRFLGQVTQNAADTGPVFDIVPTANDGAGNKVVAASYIELPTAITPGTAGIGVQIDLTNGGVIGNTIWINDINGGATGYKVVNPGSGSIAYEQNKIHFGYIHGQTTRVAQIGTSSTNQSTMRYNNYQFGRIDPGSGATVGWDSWAVNDTYTNLAIDNETAAATTGLKFESGANNNTVIGGVVQATTPLSDSGTGNVYFNVKGLTNTYSKLMMAFAAGGGTQAQNTTAFTLIGSNPTENTVVGICPYAGTFKNLNLLISAPASGQTVTATWRVANADSSVTCTVTGVGTTCSDTTHTAACTAGQSYDLKTVTSATTGTITVISGGIELDSP